MLMQECICNSVQSNRLFSAQNYCCNPVIPLYFNPQAKWQEFTKSSGYISKCHFAELILHLRDMTPICSNPLNKSINKYTRGNPIHMTRLYIKTFTVEQSRICPILTPN